MLESRGIATTVLGLARPTLEKAQPPRSLFVPFELGRPVGEPNDAAFQARVLQQALGLLDRHDGPVILVDFPDDAPGATDQAQWHPPLPSCGAGTTRDIARWIADVSAEIALLRPAWEQARQASGRTTVGVSGQPPQDWAEFAASFMTGATPGTVTHTSPALALRYLIDDLKAYYGEAAQAHEAAPSSRQINQWFWRETIAGAFVLALREACIGSPNKAIDTVASRFFVPRPYLPD